MISFIVGCDPGVPGALEEYLRMLEDIEEYDGFVQTLLNREEPWKALVCFETEEQAQTAQWMLDMNGAERREGRGEDAESDGDIETDGYQYPGSAGTDGGNAGVCGYRQREEQDAAGAGKRSGSLAEQQDCDDHQDKGKDGTQTRRETAGSVRKDAENGDRA